MFFNRMLPQLTLKVGHRRRAGGMGLSDCQWVHTTRYVVVIENVTFNK